jgi:toxin CcdB
MAQFDVYRNSGKYSGIVPFVVDIQSEILSNFDTRIVIPLQSAEFIKSGNMDIIAKLNPILTVCDTEVVLAPQQMAAVHIRELGKKVDSLESMRMEIISALDVLTSGI